MASVKDAARKSAANAWKPCRRLDSASSARRGQGDSSQNTYIADLRSSGDAISLMASLLLHRLVLPWNELLLYRSVAF
jgi:hypothetical protein